MTQVRFQPIATEVAQYYRAGGLDAHGAKPERNIAAQANLPCRHCLSKIVEGEEYLTLAYCPFPELQPYAEVGPIFLHAGDCSRYKDTDTIPAMYLNGEPRILRGYDSNNRIIYGTGKVVAPEAMIDYAEQLFEIPEIAYVHARSSSNNCFSCRIEIEPH